jgi:DNA (cytosine-5)-methyltransferase 1
MTGKIRKYATLCSGIEAVSMASESLDLEAVFFSDIEKFPIAVLEHHYPETPQFGDMMAWREWPKEKLAEVDLLVAGTPCQAFSVAGGRKSLEDDRGNLTLEFVRICDAIDNIRSDSGKQPAWFCWENVPGVLSVEDNAFGCLLAALVGSDTPIQPTHHQGWTGAGVVSGPKRTAAWRIIDAQYTGVAQRRRRVFVVASASQNASCAKILFESEGVRRDIAPSRKKGETAAACLGVSPAASSQPNVANGQGNVVADPPDWPADVTCTMNAAYGDKQGIEDQHALAGASMFVPDGDDVDKIQQTFGMSGFGAPQRKDTAMLTTNNCSHIRGDSPLIIDDRGDISDDDIATPLRVGGEAPTLITEEPVMACIASGQANAPATEDGSVPTLTCLHEAPIFALHSACIGRNPEAGPRKDYKDDECGYTLDATGQAQAVAYAMDSLQSNAMKSDNPHSGCRPVDLSKTLDATVPEPSKNQGGMAVLENGDKAVGGVSIVRRLTPIECERLQGFPDNYTRIPYRNKPPEKCPDGPRYKALGNSMAVPVMKFLITRIVEANNGE